MSLPHTLQADPDFLDKHAERIERWKGIVRSDPRRAIRVLSLSGLNSETIEGDKALDSQYVIGQLREISRDAKSDEWKALVNAGVVGALCKCALNFQAALIKQGDPQMSKKELANAAKEMFAPYFLPLEILCNASVSGTTPPTATEKKMAEEVKKHWSSIMQRVWSEPAHSLDPEPKQTRILERLVVPQLVGRLILFDPSFLDVIMKPTDLTFAVIFRYWMHATTVPDSRMNLAILLPLLEPPYPPHWKSHFDQNPPPPMKELFPRIILGASKTAGSDKKKRTPGQAADAIVSAAAAHLEAFSLQDVQFEYNFFHAIFNHSRTDNRVFLRAVFKSEKFWAANAKVMRRAAEEKTPFGEALYTGAFMTYTTMPHIVDEDGKEFIDALAYNWLSTGLFDLLEDTVDIILKIERGAMLLTGIMAAIERWLPKFSLKTTALLRAQLPRPRLMKKLLVPGIVSGDGEREQMERDYENFVKLGLGAGPQNAMFIQGAWQMLALIAVQTENEDECARRGCEKKAVDAEGNAEHVCGMCKVTAYCSKKCQESDQVEHRHVCGWLPVIEQTVHSDKPKKIRTAGGGAAAGPSNPPPDPPNMSKLALEDLD